MIKPSLLLKLLGLAGVIVSTTPATSQSFSEAYSQLQRDAKFLGRTNRCEALGYKLQRPLLENFITTAIESASEYMDYQTAEYTFTDIATKELETLNRSDRNLLAGSKSWDEMRTRADATYTIWQPICARYSTDPVYRNYLNGVPSAGIFFNSLQMMMKVDKDNYPIAQD